MADPICRWRNATPETICEIIEQLPKKEMSEDEFRQVMLKSKWGESFNQTVYQLACQTALYYIDDNHIYHPRFSENITKDEAEKYLHHWFHLYYIPNPYTQKGFNNLKKPQYFERTLFENLQNQNSSDDFSKLLNETFKDEIGELDILKNLINRYSDFLKVEDNKIKIEIKGKQNMEINVDRNDKKFFFDSFNENNSSPDIPYPRNRIIFGAPGTGKSHKLNIQCEEFFGSTINQKTLSYDERAKREIQNAKNDYSACFAIGLKYADVLKNVKQANELISKYGSANKYAAYRTFQGIRAKQVYDKLPNLDESEITIDKIKEEIEKINKEKYLLQASCGAIGYKYSDFLSGFSLAELKEQFGFKNTTSESYWINIGIHAADYSFEDDSVQKSTKHYERVTFHPNYSYSQFVGTYKPTMKSVQTDDGEKEEITYSFVAGPFLRVYVNAVNNQSENFLLLIEEINRANVASVFGDVFQLLDRKTDGTSEYPGAASDDIRKYLKSNGIDQTELSIPANMYIWATMNSADQGVFPMDTAFKRRWNFEYIGIDENESGVSTYDIPINEKTKVNWNGLRKAINSKLISAKVNEDKLLGPYFISENDLKNAMQKPADFIKLFKSKVIMYLFEDAAKMKKDFFKLTNGRKYIYSDVCKELDENGIAVFNFSEDEKGALKEEKIVGSNPTMTN